MGSSELKPACLEYQEKELAERLRKHIQRLTTGFREVFSSAAAAYIRGFWEKEGFSAKAVFI